MMDDQTSEAGSAAAMAGATAGASSGAAPVDEAQGDSGAASSDQSAPALADTGAGTLAPPAEPQIEPSTSMPALPPLTDEQMAQIVYAMLRENADLRGDSSYPIWGQLALDRQVALIADVHAVRDGSATLPGHPLITAVVHAFDAETVADEEV